MRFTLFLLALCLALTPALAAKSVTSRPAPKVLDNTGISAEVEGVLRPGCAPWEKGTSVGVELPNHLGAVVYVDIKDLKEAPGSTFRATPGELEEGRAVIFRCTADDSSCMQQNGTVRLIKADKEVFLGRLETEQDKVSFILKLVPMKAGCVL